MQIIEAPKFKKTVKKLHPNQKADLDNAINEIINNISLGHAKKGDLTGIMVHKFKMQKQLTLLSYSYDDEKITLYLISVGSRENFYQQLKRQIKDD